MSGHLRPEAGGGPPSLPARGINDSGVIVGRTENAAGFDVPFLYTETGGMTAITDGGTEIFGRAQAINNNGLVTGTANGRAFLFDSATLELTYVTPVASQRAVDINLLGQMIGTFDISSSLFPISTLAWVATGEDGFDLLENRIGQDLSDPTWRITTAQDVNDFGWILATAYNVPERLGYQVLLRPVPEPGAAGLLAAAVFLLLQRRTLRR